MRLWDLVGLGVEVEGADPGLGGLGCKALGSFWLSFTP